MAYSVIPKMRRDAKIVLKDNGGTNTLEISFEEGNFTFTPTNSELVIIFDRHTISNVRKGSEQASASGSFTLYLRQFTDGSEAGSALDFVNQTGHYSGNVSTGNSGTPRVEEYCVDIEFQVEGTDLGDDEDHKAILRKCICDVVITDADPMTIQINFVSYGDLEYIGPA